jgi:hypothetical protein
VPFELPPPDCTGAAPGCCADASDCDDGDPCTIDACNGRTCEHVPAVGCCNVDAECQQGDPCYTDVCLSNGCRHLLRMASASGCCDADSFCAYNDDDGNPCTAEKCVRDPGSGFTVCAHLARPGCAWSLPYGESFDAGSTPDQVGWEAVDVGAGLPDAWRLGDGGPLGPDGHLELDDPGQAATQALIASPTLDASTARTDPWNPAGETTLQWRMAYQEGSGGTGATLTVVAAGGGSTWKGLLSLSASQVDYDLFSAALPAAVRFAADLRVGFLFQGPGDSSPRIWEVDDVRVAAGVPNRFLRALVSACPPWQDACTPDAAVRTDEVPAGDELALSLHPCDAATITMCYVDADVATGSWNATGPPVLELDGPPLDAPWFVAILPCETSAGPVAQRCGGDANYFCTAEIHPYCRGDAAGEYRAGLVSRDGGGPGAGGILESLTRLRIDVVP